VNTSTLLCERPRITICDLAFSARVSSIQCNIVGELISQGLLFEAETMLDATLDSVMRFRLGPNIDNVMQTVQQHKVGQGNAQLQRTMRLLDYTLMLEG
jgi:hypothetical protein